MTAPSSIDPARFLAEQLAQASPDLLRQLLTTFIDTLMSVEAEADAVCGAEYGQRSPDRNNVRNGYRAREFDTRAGTLEVAIPKLRTGSYFPDWLLERRRRAERAPAELITRPDGYRHPYRCSGGDPCRSTTPTARSSKRSNAHSSTVTVTWRSRSALRGPARRCLLRHR